MFEPEPVDIQAPDGVPVFLWRIRNPDQPPVLLLHGASARHESFLAPVSYTPLAHYLREHFEPWLLDWRGSGRVVDEAQETGTLETLQAAFNFDRAAEHDVVEALRTIERERPGCDIAALGHCMGAATLAQSIAAGHTGKTRLRRVVLLALGLFYEPAFDGRVKSQDYLLERARDDGTLVVDPRPASPWSGELAALYANWPSSLRPHPGDAISEIEHMCNRISFMYGPPYREQNLAPEFHQHALPGQFGGIPLAMYIHGAQNVRRGWAARVNADLSDTRLIDDGARKHFDELDAVTLVTGANNELWHRDSIDRMYEWLMRRPPGSTLAVRKHIVPGYAHQDLLWGTQSAQEVFPRLLDGLR